MSADQRVSLFDGIADQTAGLVGEVRALALARWRLLQLELTAVRDQLRSVATVFALAFCALLVAMPVLIVAAADALDGAMGIPRWGWLLGAGLILCTGALLSAYLAWRRYRREFTGLAESLEECREDLTWLREWSERASNSRERSTR